MTSGSPDQMRILILAQQWEPEEGTPQRRWAPLVEALIRRGDKVVVVAPPPHYPGGLLTSKNPDVQVGATAKGRHGEVIVRCSFAEHDQTLRSRIWDQGVVGVSTAHAARRIIGKQRPDIILTTAPPIPAAYVTSLVATLYRIPYIVDLRDVWPDLLKYLNEWGLRADQERKGRSIMAPAFAVGSAIASGCLRIALRGAAGITTTTPSFAELLRARGFENVLNVRNTASVLARPVPSIEQRDGEELRILYVGTTGRAQGLHSAMSALELANARVKIQMRVIGSGAALKPLQEDAAARGLPVEFFGRIPHQEVREHYEWADTTLVHLRDWEPLQYTVPSKLYESLSAGRHVSVAANGETARIVEETGVGHAVPAMQPQKLADLWEHLANNRELLDIGDSGILWLQARESQVENAEKFANFVEQCANHEEK